MLTRVKKGDRVIMTSCLIGEQYKGRVWDVVSDPWMLLETVEVVTLQHYVGNSFGGFPVRYLRKVVNR